MNKIKNKKAKNLKDGRSKYNIFRGLKNFHFNFAKRSQLIVAYIELVNGDVEQLLVKVKDNSFKLSGKRYIVHEKYLKYNRTLKMWEGKYHEKLSLPIDQTVPAKDIIKQIKADSRVEVQDIVNNTDPLILEQFTTSQIVQKVFAGELMNNVFGFIKIMLIVIALGVGICAFILISGVV